MSRLEAALQRAATGVVAACPTFDPGIEAQEPMPVPEAALVRNEASRAHSRRAVVEPPIEPFERHERLEDEEEPRFHAFNAKHMEKLIVSPTMSPSLREHYRRLGAMLHHAQAESGLKTLMLSSALPAEGKTLTATNIALTLSESYERRVLLIDADLRRPSLHDIFQLPKVFGLNEALTSVPERRVSLIQVSRLLSLLPAGTPHPDPMSMLTSDRMKRLLAEATAAFDWVIIDTPPVGILTDAKLLSNMVGAALLVIRAGKTPAAMVQKAVDALGRNRIMGVVLNQAEPRHGRRSDYYYGAYYYSSPRRA